MSFGNLVAGDRWGRIQCLGRFEVMESRIYDGVEEERPVVVYRLKCDCGKLRDVKVREWKGKKRVKDCGCGIGYASDPVVMVNFMAPVTLVDEMKVAAAVKENGVSQWLRDAVREKLDRDGKR